tara:strand:- start:508 stop:1755 length:1248 start_codon:yes stop_codon:yes gene_type:complete
MTEKIAIKELQSLEEESGLVILYELALDADGSSRAYFTRGEDTDLTNLQMYDFDTNTQVNTYDAIPVEAEGFEVKSQGAAARPVITFANILSTFGDALGSLTPDDLIGKKLYRRKTLKKYLKGGSADTGSGNTPVEFPRQIYIIDRIEQENAIEISFELTTPFDVEGLVLPYRVIGNNACSWVYQGASPNKINNNTDTGGCTWSEESKLIMTNGSGTDVTHTVYVNQDDEYVIPSTTSFTTYSSGAITLDTYYKTTTTLAATGVQRLKMDGTVDTSANGSTINNLWQATAASNSPGTPSDSNALFDRIRIHTTYSASADYFAYTEDRFNDYVVHTSGGKTHLWKATRTQTTGTNTAPGFNNYWERGDSCGKRLTSCACRFGFNPLATGSASTGSTNKNSQKPLPFGGFPGARKFR